MQEKLIRIIMIEDQRAICLYVKHETSTNPLNHSLPLGCNALATSPHIRDHVLGTLAHSTKGFLSRVSTQ